MSRLSFGENIYHFARLESTNNKAKELLDGDDIPEGSAVKCDDQYAGKGLAQNKWESEPSKNITISYILKPAFLSPQSQFWITIAVSLGIKATVEHLIGNRSDTYIKWPNDIYLGDNKIAGILIENTIMGNSIIFSVVGIGLNVNQEVFKSGAPNPTSLVLEGGKKLEIDHCIKILSANLEIWYDKLRNDEYHQLMTNYTKSLYRLGVKSWYRSSLNDFEGIIEGVDDFGKLKILVPGKGYSYFDFKQIAFLNR